MEFDFRFENFKRKFSSNLFACNLIIEYSKKNREIFLYKALEKRNIETNIKI